MEAGHGHGQSPPTPSSSETLMAALLNVPATELSSLARALAADARRLRCRLAFLLLSPPHFGRALARLRAMPLHAKAALLGRVLLRSLLLLLPALCPDDYGGGSGGGGSHQPHHLLLQQPDLDAALLLLAMCDSYSPAAASPSPVVDWRALIVDDVVASALSVSGLGATPWAALSPYVDAAAKCRRFADVVSSSAGRGAVGVGGTTKDGAGSGAASYAAVLALPPAAGDGAPCAICREVMVAHGRVGVGAGVCALRPCGHRFHWRCALRWLARRNTCPCCRAELPAQDTAAESRRLWRAVERMARGG
ncbi:hypothetical protein BAE44_0014868 [Dichanthelium oligosanthes]|uniref:RING-type domain-containing protein n=1 Tax=Dichanthelium oligosanthes TaxID=888268 RepID=A0A1E5VG55_9POAL|nr:hypothetical protein BAE44_0014868 [Dichanthelium oligosanthes]